LAVSVCEERGGAVSILAARLPSGGSCFFGGRERYKDGTHFQIQIQNPDHDTEVTLTIQNHDVIDAYQAYSLKRTLQ
jgi:hypothetical protein